MSADRRRTVGRSWRLTGIGDRVPGSARDAASSRLRRCHGRGARRNDRQDERSSGRLRDGCCRRVGVDLLEELMAARDLLKPFTNAIAGVVYAFRTQRHMRVHLYTVVVIILIGFFMQLRLREMIVLLFMMSFVVVAEMFNSAIEAVVDLAEPKYHPLAKFAKDMAAGGVLVTTMTAIVVALLLFIGDGRWQEIALQLKSAELQTSVPQRIAVGMVVLMVFIVIGKGMGKRGQVLKGGLVSGHAAFAFFCA